MIRKRGSRYQVLVYDVATGRKRSVGTRGTWREARQLEAANVRDRPSDKAPLVREFAALWFDVYSRPEPTTNRHNRQMVKPFLATFGDRPLDTIGRAEAKAWAQRHPHAAKVAAALFNDAIDAEAASSNPFARLGLARGRGRQDAIPLTEEQVQRLADCSLTALDRFYGPTVRAMILFHAYTGLRSGELCGVEWRDLTGDELVVARQVRPDGSLALPKTKRVRRIVVPPIALDAVGTVPQQYDWIFPSARGKRMARGSHLYAFNQVKQAAGLIVISSRALEATAFQVENMRIAYVFYESGLSINVMYTVDDPNKRVVGFKLSEGMDIPAERASPFKFASQKSKLAGTIRGSYFDFNNDY